MTTQTELDFTNVVHTRENNDTSEKLLKNNHKKISGDCKKVYDLLKSGKRLRVKQMILEHDISSPPRRILDLKEKLGLDIKTDILGGRIAEYYL